MQLDTIVHSEALTFTKSLPDESVDCVVTSPPYYGLRDYGTDGQMGLEDTPQAFIARLVGLFAEIRRTLKKTGVVWVNLGDSYNGQNSSSGEGESRPKSTLNGGRGVKPHEKVHSQRRVITSTEKVPYKSLLMIPARFAIAMQDDGWILRSECVWVKPNPMPESVTDRPTKSHEMVYMFTRSPRYWYDADSIREEAVKGSAEAGARNYRHGTTGNQRKTVGQTEQNIADGRNRRDVFTIATEPNSFSHFATFPQALIEPLILAGCPKGGIVFDPFMGSGTTALVARRLGRHYIGCDLNAEYVALANTRLQHTNKEELTAALEGKPTTRPMFE